MAPSISPRLTWPAVTTRFALQRKIAPRLHFVHGLGVLSSKSCRWGCVAHPPLFSALWIRCCMDYWT
eukprot:223565-Chlamydomonas_euryale.AAC.1